MKNIITICFVLTRLHVFSQEASLNYPPIHTTGYVLHDFVPVGWKIRDSISCDFNKDGKRDYALVIEREAPFKILNDTICFSNQPYYPKMLLIILGGANSSYTLSAKATKLFGTCNWGVQGLDPYEKLFIDKNNLGISFLTGGTERNYISYKARLSNNEWYIIGMDAYEYWAGHTEGGTSSTSVNYLTGEEESYDSDEHGKRSAYKKEKHRPQQIKLQDMDHGGGDVF